MCVEIIAGMFEIISPVNCRDFAPQTCCMLVLLYVHFPKEKDMKKKKRGGGSVVQGKLKVQPRLFAACFTHMYGLHMYIPDMLVRHTRPTESDIAT